MPTECDTRERDWWCHLMLYLLRSDSESTHTHTQARRLLVLCCGCHSRDIYGKPITNHSTNVEVCVLTFC